MIRIRTLDGYFLLEDYERALTLLEKPLPDMEGADHANAINKIKAHLALQKGKQEGIH